MEPAAAVDELADEIEAGDEAEPTPAETDPAGEMEPAAAVDELADETEAGDEADQSDGEA